MDQRVDYVESVNRAMDYVLAHLADPLPLEAVAQAAGFSPFHFHRVFKGLMGETLNEFVRRLRLERALSLMSRAPTDSLTTIALQCGFASSSDFSRSFKQRYGVAPSRFELTELKESRHAELLDLMKQNGARPNLDRIPPGENPDGFTVAMRSLPPRTMAYLRVLDPYHGGVIEAYRDLMTWAEERGVADRDWYGYMWDDPQVVALEDCRYDVAVDVGDLPLKEFGELVGRYEFPAMRVGELKMKGDIALEMRALDWIFRTWLPESGLAPDDQPGFEAWDGRPFEHGTEHFEIGLHLPVRS